jgi:hypothetical protein
MQESLVNVQPAFVADNQPSELAQPSQRALQLHHPSVLAQLLAAFYSFARNSGSDASLSQSTPAPLKVVPLVSMQLGRSLPSSSAKHPGLLDRLDSVIISVRALESWTLAGVHITASGIPLASTTIASRRWRFVPEVEGRSFLYPSEMDRYVWHILPLFSRDTCRINGCT